MSRGLIAQAKDEGYSIKIARTREEREWQAIDQEVVEADPCTECGGKMLYHSLVSPRGSLRAFARCTTCGDEYEF